VARRLCFAAAKTYVLERNLRVLVLFLTVAGFPQRVFPQPVTKGQGGKGGNIVCVGMERNETTQANGTPSRFSGEA
jgi:hypothetical protein